MEELKVEGKGTKRISLAAHKVIQLINRESEVKELRSLGLDPMPVLNTTDNKNFERHSHLNPILLTINSKVFESPSQPV